MEEYIRLEEEKARRHGRTFDWQTATFKKVKHYEDEDDYSIDFKTKFLVIAFDNTIISSGPKVCPPNESKFDFRISLDESDDENYTTALMISKNDFLSIVFNDGLTSKSNLRIKPLISIECIDETDLINKTSFFEYGEEIISCFNDLFNDIHPDDLKLEKDDDDNNIGIMQSSEGSFVTNLEVNIVIGKYYVNKMLFLLMNLYVSIGIPFDPKRYFKDGSHTKITEAKMRHHYLLLIRGAHGLDKRSRDIPRILYTDMSRGSKLYGVDQLRLHTEKEMAEVGFKAYWVGSDRLIPDKGDLRIIILRSRLAETSWASPLLMFLFETLGEEEQGQAIRRALHWAFGHVFWIAQGPERQQTAAAGAYEADEARPVAKEVAKDIAAPAQAPPPPPPAPQPRTML
nr:hypothetical protein [Tanacetum cinerariifolium]